MSSEKVIRFVVDDPGAPQVRSAFPGFDQTAAKIVELGMSQLQKSTSDALESVYSLLHAIPLESGAFGVDTIRFTLRVDASGEVSIVSLAKGSLGTQAGIEVTISRTK
jgi:hypothetical protein